jgi:phosphate transport system substrate-binding protein
MYVSTDAVDRAPVQAFVDFYLSNAGELASSVGYVGLSPAAYELAYNRFERRTTGTLFGQERIRAGADVERVLRSAAPDSVAAAPSSPSPASPSSSRP